MHCTTELYWIMVLGTILEQYCEGTAHIRIKSNIDFIIIRFEFSLR